MEEEIKPKVTETINSLSKNYVKLKKDKLCHTEAQHTVQSQRKRRWKRKKRKKGKKSK